MRGKPTRAVAKLSIATIATVIITSTPAAAAHETLECEIPPNLLPLMNLLHALTELAFLLGVGLAVLGFSISGLLVMFPGTDYTRLGQKVAKHVLFGVVILLSSHGIVGFVTNEMGGVICT